MLHVRKTYSVLLSNVIQHYSHECMLNQRLYWTNKYQQGQILDYLDMQLMLVLFLIHMHYHRILLCYLQ